MKKIIFSFMLFIGGCSFGDLNSSTSSMIIVTDKSYYQDYKEAWIMAYDPNDSTREKSLKIIVEEPMVWNLIKVDNEYLASYHKQGNKPLVLQQIQYPGDKKTLR